MAGSQLNLQKSETLRVGGIESSLPELQPISKISILGVVYDTTDVVPSMWSTLANVIKTSMARAASYAFPREQ